MRFTNIFGNLIICGGSYYNYVHFICLFHITCAYEHFVVFLVDVNIYIYTKYVRLLTG